MTKYKITVKYKNDILISIKYCETFMEAVEDRFAGFQNENIGEVEILSIKKL